MIARRRELLHRVEGVVAVATPLGAVLEQALGERRPLRAADVALARQQPPLRLQLGEQRARLARDALVQLLRVEPTLAQAHLQAQRQE